MVLLCSFELMVDACVYNAQNGPGFGSNPSSHQGYQLVFGELTSGLVCGHACY